ncbi:hypothetical protein TWF718_007445 [Orbilia javanica]|uniref:Uncharacterized protein n=1 Tax=Orbilia javanica TaxID=47235 RepID=A0AAN8MY82_9PEZI
MSASPRPEKVTTQPPIDTNSNSSNSTGTLQGRGLLEKHPKATGTEATEAVQTREAVHKLAARKLGAIQKLAEMSLNVEIPGTKKARKTTTRYLSEALEVFEVLGPEFETIIALKVMRGIESKSLKETVAAMMWDKDWKLADIAQVLNSSVDNHHLIFNPIRNLDYEERGRTPLVITTRSKQQDQAPSSTRRVKSRRTMALEDAEKKLTAINDLANLQYRSDRAGSTSDIQKNGIRRYLSKAGNILDVLGPEYDEAVALAVVRGISRNELKEIIAAIMWDKEWTFETVSDILMAVARKEIWK